MTKATILTSPPQYEHSRGSISHTLRSRRAQLVLRRRVLFPVLAVVDYYEMAKRIIGDRACRRDTRAAAIRTTIGASSLSNRSVPEVASPTFHYSAGEAWGLGPSANVLHPVSGQRIRTTGRTEPRDANTLEDYYTLSLNATYQFPIGGRFQGVIGAEASNVTDESHQVRVNTRNGNLTTGVDAFTLPRELRLKFGFRF